MVILLAGCDKRTQNSGVEGIVQAQNRALETLSREIAAALQKIAQ